MQGIDVGERHGARRASVDSEIWSRFLGCVVEGVRFGCSDERGDKDEGAIARGSLIEAMERAVSLRQPQERPGEKARRGRQ